MRLLMTADTVGGVFTFCTELAAALSPRGVEVTLVTFGRRATAEQRRAIAAAGIERLHETELALEWMPDPWADVAAAQALLLEREERDRPDLIHLNGFAHGAAGWRAPTLVVGHSCVCSWWEAVHGGAPPAHWDRYRSLVRRGIAGAAAVAAPSQAMLAALGRWYGPLPAVSVAVPNGSGVAPAPAALGKRPFVLSAGRLWDEAKNAVALLRAAARPSLQGRVVLVGERAAPGPALNAGADGVGPEAVAREGAVMRGPLAPDRQGAILRGPLAPDRLARLRRRAAVYAAPARYEPFGLAILEAARDRCALVLGDIPSLREIWGDAAVYVHPDDHGALAWQLERLLADPARARALGERACRRSEPLTRAAMADRYQQIYRRLIAGRVNAAGGEWVAA